MPIPTKPSQAISGSRHPNRPLQLNSLLFAFLLLRLHRPYRSCQRALQLTTSSILFRLTISTSSIFSFSSLRAEMGIILCHMCSKTFFLLACGWNIFDISPKPDLGPKQLFFFESVSPTRFSRTVTLLFMSSNICISFVRSSLLGKWIPSYACGLLSRFPWHCCLRSIYISFLKLDNFLIQCLQNESDPSPNISHLCIPRLLVFLFVRISCSKPVHNFFLMLFPYRFTKYYLPQ